MPTRAAAFLTPSTQRFPMNVYRLRDRVLKADTTVLRIPVYADAHIQLDRDKSETK